jgi:hypothetical protein
MQQGRYQFSLWALHVGVAAVAIVLGAMLGGPVRLLIACASGAFALVMFGCLLWLFGVAMLEGAPTAWQWACRLVRSPSVVRQMFFEWRMRRLHRGNPSRRVRRWLGAPRRVDGFGDRLYWSYRIAGQRYTVSLDPRRVLTTYSNGLSPDVRVQRS